MRKASAKEIYASCLILLIGIVYLAAQTDALFSIGSTTVKGDMIQLSRNEILSHLRTVLTIILCFSGGILLLKIKTTGWIISQSILLLLLTIASGIFISNITGLNTSGIVLAAGMILLLSAILFLLQKQTRQKFTITKKSYMSVMILFAILAVFYFLLQ
ncbi:MAG: hypothetical protein H7122_10185 [Chitinophagaceae bacterium]|nr:hypothetical protein [Chitinophagaceae bacterium]